MFLLVVVTLSLCLYSGDAVSLTTAPKSLLSKLPWQSQGYSSWRWQDYNINYVDLGGEDRDNVKPALLLIHGFGASVYHCTLPYSTQPTLLPPPLYLMLHHTVRREV